MRLDTHLHLWDPALGVYTWLSADNGPLHDTFSPERARQALQSAGMDGAILVQAADATQDTDAMLAVAAEHDWVRGVVGWVDLEDPAGAEASLDRLSASPVLCGVRQLVHDDPRTNVLALPAVRATAGQLAERGLVLDVPDAFPRQLDGAATLAESLDDLVIVIDHLAKPPRGIDALDEWARRLRLVARHENVVAKVSGLERAGQPWCTEAIRPVWDIALACFGTERLMFGSDWPMTVGGAGYEGTVSVVGALVDELSPDEQDDLWWRTGSRVYDLPAPAPPEPLSPPTER